MIRRVKVGDVFEIATKNGLAYAQCSQQNKAWGSLIRVLPRFHSERPSGFADLVKEKESFVVLFPLQEAVSRKVLEVVARESVPEHARNPPIFRSAGFRDREGRVHDWWLWDGEKEWRVGRLNSEQRKLPLRQAWNDTLLIERIEEGWTPETDQTKEAEE